MAEHTPAPWHIVESPDECEFEIHHTAADSEPGPLATVHSADHVDWEGESRANAYLIASAPLLREALAMHVAKSGHTAGCTQMEIFGCSKRCQMTRAALAASVPPAETGGQP